jgi:CRP-like cAMP-binding protein
MDQAKAEQVLNELQTITRIIHSGKVPDIKPSATLLEKSIKPSTNPFIRKDASGHALYYIVEGQAGVDIGQPDRIIVPAKRTVGEMSMISTVINSWDNLITVESRTADVYAEEPMRLIVFNYSPLVEILKDPNPEFKKLRGQILISLNRILFRKLMDVNRNYVNMLVSYGLIQEAEEAQYPQQLVESLGRFLQKMRTFPNLSISPHELRGTLIHEGEPNSSLIFLEEGKIRLTMLAKDEETEEEERLEIDIINAPMIVGESSILSAGSISSAQVDTIGRVIGYRITVQNLLRNLQRYPEVFDLFFRLLLELNYFRTVHMMQKTTNL